MSWETGTATDFTDLLVKLNAFLTKGHSLPPIYTGVGSGTVTGVIGTASTVQETITVTFTSATAFSVAGSSTGAMGSGVVGSLFTHARVSFSVGSGGTAWASGDTISWVMTPPWVCMRLAGGAAHLQSANIDLTKLIDKNAATYTSCLAGDLPQWAGLQLLQPQEVRSFRLAIAGTPGNGPRDYAFQYSDVGGADANWTTGASWTAQTWSQAYEQRVHDVPAAGSHKFVRMRITAANGTTVDLSELTFYTATGGQTLDAIPWFGDAIWRAPGNANTDQIYVGAKLKWNAIGAYWCWHVNGYAGYVAGAPFESQPGGYGHAYLSLWNAEIPYWFIADGKCVKIIAKISSQYEQAYLGFIDSYISPGNYPYPMFVGGSMGFNACSDPGDTSALYRYAVNDETHRAFWSPGGESNNNNWYWGEAALRKVDGSWKCMAGIANSGGNPSQIYIWPQCNMRSNDPRAQDVRLNLDGSVMMLPLMLTESAPNVLGELSGVMHVCGNNQSVENIITIDRVDWIVIQNIARVGVGDYAAFRLA